MFIVEYDIKNIYYDVFFIAEQVISMAKHLFLIMKKGQ